MRLEAGEARVVVDPEAGGRIASLAVAGLELLVAREHDPFRWGCYPMAPFAGRLRRGQFTHDGRTHALPLNLPPHAIHGTVCDRPWQQPSPGTLRIDLGPDWPFAGHAVQQFALDADGLDLQLSVHAEREPFPASIGWHPWFRRELDRGEPARLSFSADSMYCRDEEGIPTGARVPPPAGPWDDCFTDLAGPPTIAWPGALQLCLASDASHWVVYDEPAHALCVEPQSGPPDALTLEPRIVTPDRPLELRTRLTWT